MTKPLYQREKAVTSMSIVLINADIMNECLKVCNGGWFIKPISPIVLLLLFTAQGHDLFRRHRHISNGYLRLRPFGLCLCTDLRVYIFHSVETMFSNTVFCFILYAIDIQGFPYIFIHDSIVHTSREFHFRSSNFDNIFIPLSRSFTAI
jgi:hypothetical protein